MRSNNKTKKHPHEHSATDRYDLFLSVKNKPNKNFLHSPSANKIFKKADDGILSTRELSELYDNVPKHLQKVCVTVMELHNFNCSPIMKKKVKKWLNQN